MTAPTHALLTDLYQLTMLQAYFENDMEEEAVFEFFVRKLPANRGFLLAAGLHQVLDYLENLQFSAADLDWIGRSGFFTAEFARRLAGFRFTGAVDAMAEGSVFFPDEPILRVTAPLPQAQLVESRIINLLHFQSLIASKAARCVLAAPGRLLVDFGMRRAHGAEASLLAARAGYIAGFDGTSNVQAASAFGIPVYGTMAHSFVQVHDDEQQAFERFAASQPENVVLLIDTYDTKEGARKVVAAAPGLRQRGIRIRGVRLDSGNLEDHAREVRRILDGGGCGDTAIFCSGNLDEFKLADMLKSSVPVDGFGVGTHLDTSRDAPALDCAYKLVAYAGTPRRKRSEEKSTLPGPKQVFRRTGEDGRMRGDILTVDGDEPGGEALIRPVMRGGRRIGEPETLVTIRERAAGQLATLPGFLRALRPGASYPVKISPALREMVAAADRTFR